MSRLDRIKVALSVAAFAVLMAAVAAGYIFHP